MSISQINELYMEMETIIRELSETLISELANRDEFEYEKELKNSFISLLLAVQNRRRQFHIEKKRGKAQGKQQSQSGEFICVTAFLGKFNVSFRVCWVTIIGRRHETVAKRI